GDLTRGRGVYPPGSLSETPLSPVDEGCRFPHRHSGRGRGRVDLVLLALVAAAADGASVRGVVAPAPGDRDDVVGFCAVGLSAVSVVEEYAADGAVCDAVDLVPAEYGPAESLVGSEPCSAAGHWRPSWSGVLTPPALPPVPWVCAGRSRRGEVHR